MTQFNQEGQTVWGSQQNAGRDINNIFPRLSWTPPVMLPPRAQSFVGREDDVAWLLQQLTSEEGMTLALCGPGGVGKTALAAEVLTRLVAQEDWLTRFPGGIFYHSFYTFPSLDVAFEELARLFEEEPGADPRRAAIRALSHHRTLLVFDGVEILDDSLPLRELGGKHVVLLLSRRQSDVPDLAHHRTVDLLSQGQAIALLQGLASSRAEDHSCVRQLVEYIGGYPLALQLIGSYLSSRQEEVANYLQWFEQEGLAAIDFGKHQAQSVPIVLQRTYDTLTSSEQQVFVLLGLFAPAPFPFELVQGILELPERAVRQALGSLVNFCVLRRPGQSYEVSHPLVHTFAKERFVSQENVAFSDDSGIIRIWRERFLATLKTYFDQRNPYDKVFLLLWHPHVFPLLSAEYVTAEQSLTAASLFNAAGFAASKQGRYTVAELLYKRALEIREQQLGGEHPSIAQSLNNLAALYYSQGRYEDAEPLYERALMIREQRLGGEHPSTAQSLNNLAALYHMQKKYTDAEPLYERALMIREQQLRSEQLDTALSLNNQEDLHQMQRKYVEAEPSYERALTTNEQMLGATHSSVAITLFNLAHLHQAQENYEQAESFFLKAIAIDEKVYGTDHTAVVNDLDALAELLMKMRREDEAQLLKARAQAIREKYVD